MSYCQCGQQSGYPHTLDCPYPYYGKDQKRVLDWQRDRGAKQLADLAALRAENAKLREALQSLLDAAMFYQLCPDKRTDPHGIWQSYAKRRWGEQWAMQDVETASIIADKIIEEARAALAKPR